MIRGNSGSCSLNQTVNGTLQENAPFISPPPNNTSLLAYAQSDGKVYSGTTRITLNGNTASVTVNGVAQPTVDLTADPIIYVTNASGCSGTYSPYNVTYPTSSPCGNVYVSGNYSTSATIAAANDIVVMGNVTTNLSGPAVIGLVANNFIRVRHGVTARSAATAYSCGSAANIAAETHPNIRIDAAILALRHSFIVDNYDCGVPIGELEVNGAIRAALPRHGRHVLGRHGPDRLPEGIHLRRPPPGAAAAVPVRSRLVQLARRPRDAVRPRRGDGERQLLSRVRAR